MTSTSSSSASSTSLDTLEWFVGEVGSDGPVTIAGLSTRGGAVPDVRCVRAPSGIAWVQADEMTCQCGAGTPVDELSAALREVGQRVVLPEGGTVGGALASGRSGIRRLGDGPLRDVLLQTRYVGADGELVKAGGPTVKNVSGFDVCRLLVGSLGTLGFLGDVILRTRPLAHHSAWFTTAASDPTRVFTALHRPVSVLWDGVCVWALLEGHAADVREQAAAAGLDECDGLPPIPTGRRLLIPPSSVARLGGRTGFVAELGVGVVHLDDGDVSWRDEISVPAAPGTDVLRDRVKALFDPTGRMNPGVQVG